MSKYQSAMKRTLLLQRYYNNSTKSSSSSLIIFPHRRNNNALTIRRSSFSSLSSLISPPQPSNNASTTTTTTSSSRSHSTTTTESENKRYDVLIVGGGAVGATLAKRLTDTPQISIGLIEPRPPPPRSAYESSSSEEDAPPMARSYALSPSSFRTLGEDVANVLKEMGRYSPYDKMQVWEHDGPAMLQFSSSDISPSPDNILGAMVEDGPLVSTLWDILRQRRQSNVDLFTPAIVDGITNNANSNEGSGIPPLSIGVKCLDTKEVRRVTTSLLVAADGANSSVRRLLGMPMLQMGYGRRAITCTVSLSSPHNATAYQRFLPHGPIALLPQYSTTSSSQQQQQHHATIVWSTTPTHASHLLSLPPSSFTSTLNDVLSHGPTPTRALFNPHNPLFPPPLRDAVNGLNHIFGTLNDGLAMSQQQSSPSRRFRPPPEIAAVVGPRLSFDLNASRARECVGSRVALVGDAARTIHPMAGQGLNLGLGDVDRLVRLIEEAVRLGEDVGHGSAVLERYGRERSVVGSVMLGGVGVLHEVMGGEEEEMCGGWGVVRGVRSLGMNLVNGMDPVRKGLAEVAAWGVPVEKGWGMR